jgi:hypothetical protein
MRYYAANATRTLSGLAPCFRQQWLGGLPFK